MVARALGDEEQAKHFELYASSSIAQARSAPAFPANMGLHAAAEAIIGGWLSRDETDALLKTLFNDVTQICSLSGFNT